MSVSPLYNPVPGTWLLGIRQMTGRMVLQLSTVAELGPMTFCFHITGFMCRSFCTQYQAKFG